MKRLYGILSLICIKLAVIMAAFQIYNTASWWWVLIYLFLVADSALIIILAYCTKCCAKTDCAHVLPGLLTKLFKDRQPGPYKRSELILTFISMGIIMLFPQYWLVKNLTLFVSFWILCAIGLVLIIKNICNRCDNLHCPFNKSEKSK